MDLATRKRVRARAGDQCEYCQLLQELSPLARLQIEHVTPKKHGGPDIDDNLALACIHCNSHKGSNLTGIDPVTRVITELFDPRTQSWSEHFEWNGPQLDGLTAIGRTTIRVLDMNADELIHLRIAAADSD